MSYFNKIIPRVAKSAKLPNIKGSAVERTRMAEDLSTKFTEFVNDAFKKQTQVGKDAFITKKEIGNWIKENCKNVNVKLKRNKDKTCGGAIRDVANIFSGTVKGYSIHLPFKSSLSPIIDKEGARVLIHESRHLFDYITQPKIVARSNTKFLIGLLKDVNYKTIVSNWNFYSEFLRKPELTKEAIKEDLFLLENRKKLVQTHFHSTSTKQRIEHLQEWRHRLKTEKSAFTDELSKTHYILNGKSINKLRLEDFHSFFRFPEKIKILKELLKDEITSVRKQHAATLNQ